MKEYIILYDNELDGINSNGDLDYNVYVDIHNIIGNIYNRFIEE